MQFRNLKKGDLFVLAYDRRHQTAIKLTEKTAMFLATGEVEPIRWNKAVDTPQKLSGKFLLGFDHDENPCLLTEIRKGELWGYRVVPVEIITGTEDTLKLSDFKGEDSEKLDEVNIILENMAKSLKNAVTLAETARIMLHGSE